MGLAAGHVSAQPPSSHRFSRVGPNTWYSAKTQTGSAANMSTTECCLTKAVDIEMATAETTMKAFQSRFPSLLWQNTEAMATE